MTFKVSDYVGLLERKSVSGIRALKICYQCEENMFFANLFEK